MCNIKLTKNIYCEIDSRSNGPATNNMPLMSSILNAVVVDKLYVMSVESLSVAVMMLRGMPTMKNETEHNRFQSVTVSLLYN